MMGYEEEYYYCVRGFYEKFSEYFMVFDFGVLDDWWVVVEYDN